MSVIGSCAAENRFVHFKKRRRRNDSFLLGVYSVHVFFFLLVFEVFVFRQRAVSSSFIHNTVLLFLHWRWNSKLSTADWSTNSSVMFFFLNKVGTNCKFWCRPVFVSSCNGFTYHLGKSWNTWKVWQWGFQAWKNTWKTRGKRSVTFQMLYLDPVSAQWKNIYILLVFEAFDHISWSSSAD